MHSPQARSELQLELKELVASRLFVGPERNLDDVDYKNRVKRLIMKTFCIIKYLFIIQLKTLSIYINRILLR